MDISIQQPYSPAVMQGKGHSKVDCEKQHHSEYTVAGSSQAKAYGRRVMDVAAAQLPNALQQLRYVPYCTMHHWLEPALVLSSFVVQDTMESICCSSMDLYAAATHLPVKRGTDLLL